MTTIVRIDANELASMHNSGAHHHHHHVTATSAHLLPATNQAIITNGQTVAATAPSSAPSSSSTVSPNESSIYLPTGTTTTLAPVQVLFRNSYSTDTDHRSPLTVANIGNNQVLLTTSSFVKLNGKPTQSILAATTQPLQSTQSTQQQQQQHHNSTVSATVPLIVGTTSTPTQTGNGQLQLNHHQHDPQSQQQQQQQQQLHQHVPSVNSESSNGSIRSHNDKQNLYGQHLSESSKASISHILSQIEKLNDLERLYLYLQLPDGSDNSGDSNGALDKKKTYNYFGKKTDSEIIQTYAWIQTHLEEDISVSIPKNEVYQDYSAYCEANNFEKLCVADFGKAMKQIFPKVKPRRLGQRGNSRYCYSGMRKRTELESPELPILETNSLADITSIGSQSNACSIAGNSSSTGKDASSVNNSNNNNNDGNGKGSGKTKLVDNVVMNIVMEWSEKVFNKRFKTSIDLARAIIEGQNGDMKALKDVGQATLDCILPGMKVNSGCSTPTSAKKKKDVSFNLTGSGKKSSGKKKQQQQQQQQQQPQNQNTFETKIKQEQSLPTTTATATLLAMNSPANGGTSYILFSPTKTSTSGPTTGTLALSTLGTVKKSTVDEEKRRHSVATPFNVCIKQEPEQYEQLVYGADLKRQNDDKDGQLMKRKRYVAGIKGKLLNNSQEPTATGNGTAFQNYNSAIDNGQQQQPVNVKIERNDDSFVEIRKLLENKLTTDDRDTGADELPLPVQEQQQQATQTTVFVDQSGNNMNNINFGFRPIGSGIVNGNNQQTGTIKLKLHNNSFVDMSSQQPQQQQQQQPIINQQQFSLSNIDSVGNSCSSPFTTSSTCSTPVSLNSVSRSRNSSGQNGIPMPVRSQQQQQQQQNFDSGISLASSASSSYFSGQGSSSMLSGIRQVNMNGVLSRARHSSGPGGPISRHVVNTINYGRSNSLSPMIDEMDSFPNTFQSLSASGNSPLAYDVNLNTVFHENSGSTSIGNGLNHSHSLVNSSSRLMQRQRHASTPYGGVYSSMNSSGGNNNSNSFMLHSQREDSTLKMLLNRSQSVPLNEMLQKVNADPLFQDLDPFGFQHDGQQMQGQHSRPLMMQDDNNLSGTSSTVAQDAFKIPQNESGGEQQFLSSASIEDLLSVDNGAILDSDLLISDSMQLDDTNANGGVCGQVGDVGNGRGTGPDGSGSNNGFDDLLLDTDGTGAEGVAAGMVFQQDLSGVDDNFRNCDTLSSFGTNLDVLNGQQTGSGMDDSFVIDDVFKFG